MSYLIITAKFLEDLHLEQIFDKDLVDALVGLSCKCEHLAIVVWLAAIGIAVFADFFGIVLPLVNSAMIIIGYFTSLVTYRCSM